MTQLRSGLIVKVINITCSGKMEQNRNNEMERK